MRIIKLECENIKRLTAVEVCPGEEAIVTVRGPNASGKSSVLDAIWYALGGRKAIQSEPIRQGKKTASATLDLGDLLVERKFTRGGTTLTVKNQEGVHQRSPQDLLNGLVGDLFDPLEFSRKSPADQWATLRKLCGIDTAELDRKIATAYEERKEAGTALKRDGAARDLLAASAPEDDPGMPKSMDEVLERLSDARSTNAARSEDERIVRGHQAMVKDAEAEIVDAEAEIARLQAALKHDKADLKKLRAKKLPEVLDPVDEGAIEEEMRGLEGHNAKVRAWAAAVVSDQSRKHAYAKHERLDAILEGLRVKKADSLSEVKMPIPDLGIDEETHEVTYKGVPFGQASSAEQLKASVAIAMSLNPKLRVLRILDGSLLDSGSMQIIQELAEENDFQVWVEVVDESSEGSGILIRDGGVLEPVAVTP